MTYHTHSDLIQKSPSSRIRHYYIYRLSWFVLWSQLRVDHHLLLHSNLHSWVIKPCSISLPSKQKSRDATGRWPLAHSTSLTIRVRENTNPTGTDSNSGHMDVVWRHRSSQRPHSKKQTHNTFQAAIRITLSIPLSRWESTQQSVMNINSRRIADLIVLLMSTHGSWAHSVGGLLGGDGSKPPGFLLCSGSAGCFWALD